jgi:hypothetical protein
MASMMQEKGQSVAICSGGFHTGMDSLDPLLLEPLSHGFKPWWGIGKVMGTGFGFGTYMDIEGAFGHINAKSWEWCSH